MSYDYKVELKLPEPLRFKCMEMFSDCREFDSPSTLRAFAKLVHLELVVACIEKTDTLDYNILILNLLRSRNKTSLEPALLDLINALAIEYQKDARGDEFNRLQEEVRTALLQADSSGQEEDYQRVVKDSAPGDGRDARKLAERWIDEAGGDLDELALRVALAVFNGTPFEVIEGAKKELFDMLKPLVPTPPPPPPDPENPPPVAPHVPLMRRLEKAGARETEGKPPDWQRVVELERPELAGDALVYVWQLHRESEWRQRLIAWLTNHAARHTVEVRIRAAVAVGIIAVRDYRFVRDELLNKWIHRKDPQFRTAIGMALGVLIRQEGMAEEVQGLLREWIESKDEAKRWAAMRAYIYAGPYCRPPGEAIARWREIIGSARVNVNIRVTENVVVRLRNPLHMSLMDAMVRFFFNAAHLPEEEKPPLFAGILEELEGWVSSGEENAWLGVFMFTTLGQLRVGADGDGDGGGAPVLLQLMEEGPDETGYRARLGRVFEAAMRNGNTIIETQELLCSWLGWADGLQDDSHEYEGRMLTLFKEMIAADGGGRMRGKLVACLRDCGRNRAAQRLLAAL